MNTPLPTLLKDKQIVLKAIDSLGRRVTPADVASNTGLPLLPVTATLNQIAAETDGHMEVGAKGDIAYIFSPGFQSRYLAQGYRRVLQQIWSKVFAAGFFVVRISFGIMLIINALIIVALVFLIIFYYSQRGGDDDDRGFGGGFPIRLSFFEYYLLYDILFGYPRQTTRYDYDRPTIRKSNDSNFFFNAFSFLFGDGDPNLNFEDRKWAMIAEVIRRNNGVVTAELLAPYTGAEPGNEDAVLPVLVRFDGRPEVTAVGDIVYIFPAMQVTAMEEARLNVLPSHLTEWTWKFTNVPSGQMLWVYLLAGFDFFGSWFLLAQMHAMQYSEFGNPLASFAPLIYFLIISATMFIVVPAIRWVALGFINQRIEQRNAKRLANAKILEEMPDNLLKKLSAAQTMKVDRELLSEKDAVFTTEKDSLEQEFDASP
ncbi:MAG: hypothetical protein SGJ27_09720 [Candidatus Melainabacteria bacterium]|nr:hypothetical protein [Candidatus Melainabacteria bacterium]